MISVRQKSRATVAIRVDVTLSFEVRKWGRRMGYKGKGEEEVERER